VSRHDSLRASDADRDEVVDRLRVAATEGRLAAEELDVRVHAALTALTYAELEATVRDLPSPRHRPAGTARSPRRTSAPNGVRTVGGVALTALRANPLLIVFLIPLVAVTGAMLIAASAVWAVFMLVLLMLGAGADLRGRGGADARPTPRARRASR
jgi:hypothetical protein